MTQTCVIHLLRNSFRYAGRQHYDAIAKALRPVYTAPTEAAAMERFIEFTETWGARYPAIVRLWENAWAEFVPFLNFDTEIRKVLCSTDEIVNPGFSPPSRSVVPQARSRLAVGHPEGLALTGARTPPLNKRRRPRLTQLAGSLTAAAYDGKEVLPLLRNDLDWMRDTVIPEAERLLNEPH